MVLGVCAGGVVYYLSYGKSSADSGVSSPSAARRSQIEEILDKQRKLPKQVVTALQDLRLAGAVEITYATARRGYGTIEELKKAGFLDPKWPRSDPGTYQLTCKVEPSRDGFVCYADPVSSGNPGLRIDAGQTIRHALNRRPDAESPPFP
ncbi:MAG: hypothetical protein ACKV22_07590 [Bryobacteraceae bacterium]